MACQVVLPPKPLGTELAQEVFAASVYHHVTSHVFTGIEVTLAVVTLMFLFLHVASWFPCVTFEVFQQNLSTTKLLGTHPTGEVPAGGSMKSQVSLIAQLGVVLLATLFTLEGHLVRVMSLKVIL